MAIAHVQDLTLAQTASSSSFQTGAFGSSPVAGNTILVFIWTNNGNNFDVSSVIDTSDSTTYTQDQKVVSANTNNKCWVFRRSNILGGSSFKLTVATTGLSFITVTAAEFSGLTNSSPLDGAGGTDFATTGSADTGTFSTTNANDLLIATFGSNDLAAAGTFTDPSGFTRIAISQTTGSFQDGIATYQIVSATQSNINPAWSSASAFNNWQGIGLAYKAAGAALFRGVYIEQAVNRAANW